MRNYEIVKNDYESTANEVAKLEEFLNANGFIKNVQNPVYVFVIGGDGTFLKAVHKYQDLLDQIYFVPFKFGGIGYYTNKNNLNEIKSLVEMIEKEECFQINYQILELLNGKRKHYILNEVKILNEKRPLYIKLFINDEYLETFHGTGIVVSTPTGSTGYIKSTGGSVILPKNSGLYQLQELVPVSTNIYRTLNSPIILNSDYVLRLELESLCETLICDTQERKILDNILEIKVSEKKVRVISHRDPKQISEINTLRDIFIIDKKSVK
ncbi:inorganic polyphosphate/ATP-NAD kinase [Spiroplasma helicoides]|uniref:Inorganic polyphosphate/ATP-NAD kinase n=1 Tax=Spiroplasma helicoides TaxID=216938 RepID=A0A1B3SJQ6_9MOLU|nr:NAD(+)/NADH kinase [Spiroplasma helicoides]AOG60165.1 inorganic polyphosphate/ATP-NAD kinase [Spiroplasma helicoides]